MPGNRGRTRKVWALLGALPAIGASVVIIAGCGGSSPSSSSAAGLPSAAITRAADVSAAASGYKVAINLSETAASAGQITIAGSGSFGARTGAGSMSLQMSIPSLGRLPLDAVIVPGTVYVKLPAELVGTLPGAKPWLEISLNQIGQVAGIPGLGSLASSTSSFNPTQYLGFLRATSDGTVKDLGQATVNGSVTTHYHAEVDLAKLPDAVPAASRKTTQQLVTALSSRGAVTQLPIDAWIDSAHLIRRITLAYAQPVSGGQAVNVSLQLDFTSYGPQPAPTIPAPGETANLLSLIHRASGG